MILKTLEIIKLPNGETGKVLQIKEDILKVRICQAVNHKINNIITFDKKEILELNPAFKIVDYCEPMQYLTQTDYLIKNRPKYQSLSEIKKTVENYFKIEDISKKNRETLIVEARQIYVKIASGIEYDQEKIMSTIKRSRCGFYHSIRVADNLIQTDKKYAKKYNDLIK